MSEWAINGVKSVSAESVRTTNIAKGIEEPWKKIGKFLSGAMTAVHGGTAGDATQGAFLGSNGVNNTFA